MRGRRDVLRHRVRRPRSIRPRSPVSLDEVSLDEHQLGIDRSNAYSRDGGNESNDDFNIARNDISGAKPNSIDR